MNAALESMTGLILLHPWMLLLALLVPAALWLRGRRGTPAVSFAPRPLIVAPSLPRSWRMRLLPLPRVFQVLGLLLVVLALARPVHRVQLPLETQGIDILLCLDVSSSMSSKDMDPQRTRLDVAKAAAAQFIAGRPDDRIGLISFARYPDLLCPLTLDHRALEQFLAEVAMVEPNGVEDQTGIGTAIARAAHVLRGSLAPSKVVILLTDGEENVATAQTPEEIGPLRAARMCESLGVRVYTIAAGIGRRTPSGAWIAVDTTQVQQLAEQTGGVFFAARDAGAIGVVYATIDGMEKVEFAEPRFEFVERFLPFVLTAVALVLAGVLLQSTWLRVLP